MVSLLNMEPVTLMKNTLRPWTALAAFVFALSACSNLERSRDMGNPNLSGTTMAQQVCANCHGQDGNSQITNFINSTCGNDCFYSYGYQLSPWFFFYASWCNGRYVSGS